MFYLGTVLLVCLDQVLKLGAMQWFRQPIPVVQDILYLSYLQNRGAAFGLLTDFRWLFIVVSGCVVGAIIWWERKTGRLVVNRLLRLHRVSLLFLLSGTLGNLIDRIWHGYVVDFIAFTFFPTFNLADIMINAGVIGLLLFFFWSRSTV